MKTIKIKGQQFEYEVFFDAHEFGEKEWTEFYQGTIVTYRKKYFLFGKIIKHERPKLIFKVDFNIEDLYYTKKEIREKLERKVELLNRKKEISKGEII